MKFDADLTHTDKFREVILYISQRCETDPKFSITKLNKILFYSDFVSFGRTGKSITGQIYQKLSFGPCPRGMKPVSDAMQQSGEMAIVSRPYFGRIQKKPIALRQPQLEVLSSTEIALIDEIIEAAWTLTASQISDASHGFIGWQIANIGETIPYGLAWVDEEPEFTEQEMEEISSIEPLPHEKKKTIT